MLLLSRKALVVPDSQDSSKANVYEMEKVYAAEARIPEMVSLSPTKAAELLSVISEACFILGGYLADCQLALSSCQRQLNKRKAVIVLDIIPDKIKAKGLSQNEQTRAAIIESDDEYTLLLEKKDTIEAAYVLIKEKLRAFENSLSNMRRLLGDSYGINHRNNPNLSTHMSVLSSVVDQESSDPEVVEFFNKEKKYGSQ